MTLICMYRFTGDHITYELCSSEYIYSYSPNTIERNPLDCVRLSSVAELNRTQSNGLSSIGFDLFD